MYVSSGLAATAIKAPSQFATLDMICYSGCQATGAGNCAAICAAPASSGVVADRQTAGQLIPGISNYWLLGGAATLVVLMVTR